jgi:hypothetical protein
MRFHRKDIGTCIHAQCDAQRRPSAIARRLPQNTQRSSQCKGSWTHLWLDPTRDGIAARIPWEFVEIAASFRVAALLFAAPGTTNNTSSHCVVFFFFFFRKKRCHCQ